MEVAFVWDPAAQRCITLPDYIYYIGLDIQKTASYCVKEAAGQVWREGTTQPRGGL